MPCSAQCWSKSKNNINGIMISIRQQGLCLASLKRIHKNVRSTSPIITTPAEPTSEAQVSPEEFAKIL